MNIKKSIIVIFILSISYSQDHFDELNKYLNEVNLSNTNRVLEFQMRLLEKQADSENYDYTNKIYKTLYEEDLRKLAGNAVDAIIPKWWWFDPDKIEVSHWVSAFLSLCEELKINLKKMFTVVSSISGTSVGIR